MKADDCRMWRERIGALVLGQLDADQRTSTEAHLAGCPGRSVTIVLCDDAESRALNRTWRGRDRPTDVLSFAGDSEPDGSRDQGDLVISVDTARRSSTWARMLSASVRPR